MSLDAVLKRYFPIVLLALVAVAAYFQAAGITQIIGSSLAVDEKGILASGPLVARISPTSTASSLHQTSAKKIIKRNPFDSVAGDLDPPPDASSAEMASGPPIPATDDPYNAPMCDGVKVLATAVSDDAAWSFASLVGGKDEGTISKLKRQGDEYANKRIWFIRWDRVWLIGPGSFCQVEMFARESEKAAASAKASASASAPASSKDSGGAPAVPDDIKSKIQKVSANEFNVDRSVIDKILENQAVLMRSARITPEQENGKTVGIRLYGIRPDTLLGTIGLENGDRLEKINGFDMASPEKALEAYARLRTADHLTVSINRRGQAQNIDFNIK